MINYSSINDAWGNKEIYKKKYIESSSNNIVDTPVNNIVDTIDNNILKKPVDNIVNTVVNKEHFNNCNMVEHLQNCEECKKKIIDLFTNENKYSEVNIFNIKFTVKKDILKIIFIILIVSIFIILLSSINISFSKNNLYNSQMKYMLPNEYMNYIKYMNSFAP
jgi:hypothetical protein